MSYNIPLTGQIRLGFDFNRVYFNNSSNSSQINMNDRHFRETSNDYASSDSIAYGSGAQRNLGQYRGVCNCWGWQETTVDATVEDDQGYLRESDIGDVTTSTPVYSIFGNMGYYYSASDDDTTNVSAANVLYVGYLEPGNYEANALLAIYNSGVSAIIVRGYTSGFLSGSSSDYILATTSRNSGSWGTYGINNSSFTVNSTYPYVIIAIESQNDNQFFNRTLLSRKDASYTATGIADTSQFNVNIMRVS